MEKKTTYYLIGSGLLVALLIGYHFYAASQAEQQIDKAIQEQTEQRTSISVQYSSINVAPFGGTVTISDLTLILGNHIERAQQLQLDIGYLDFLNIYLGGLNYGLNNLHKAQITAVKPSYVNRSGLEEIKLDSLTITYRGNALEGLQSAVNGSTFSTSLTINTQSKGLTIALPKTTLSKIKAQEFTYSGSIEEGQRNFWTNGTHQFKIDSLTWTPSQSFQNTYGFFIKGFGYDTDAIPFQSAQLQSHPTSKPGILKITSSVRSELALLSSSGRLKINTPLSSSEFQQMNIRITDFSDQLSGVLDNIERLLSVSLPRKNGGVALQLKGTLANPSIAQ